MPFKTIRKATSSFLRPKKSISNVFTAFLDGSNRHVTEPRRSSADTIRLTAAQPSPSVNTINPIDIPDIRIEYTDGTIINATQDGKRAEDLYEELVQEVQELWDLQKRAAEMQRREQVFGPPKLDVDEYVIAMEAGRVRTSRRTLILWDRGWVDMNTWLEDEIKKMDQDQEYLPMGCGL